MKTIQFIITTLIIACTGILAKAQSASDSVKITYKNKTVTVMPLGDESTTTVKFNDSLNKKKIVVKVSYSDDIRLSNNTTINKDDSSGKKVFHINSHHKEERSHFIETSFLPTFDIGFASTMNDNAAGLAFTPQRNKSANINIGIIRQDMNLYNNQLLLSYGLSINYYHLKYKNKQQVQYIDNNGLLNAYNDSINNYDKNRLDIRYLTVPIMIEFHSKNDKYSLAAGVEFGYKGRSKVVLKGDKNSLEFKQKNDTDIKINDTQMNAVVRLGLDNIALYAKYSLTGMYADSAFDQGQNPDQHLFSFGVCLYGI